MPTLYQYQIQHGHHVNTDDLVYGPNHENGDKFQTNQDLSKHNLPGQQPRFKLLNEGTIDVSPEQRKKDLQAQADAIQAELALLSGTTLPKDEVVQAGKSKSPQDDGLDTQSVAELKSFASDAKIDILGLNRKDEIIAAIRRAVGNS